MDELNSVIEDTLLKRRPANAPEVWVLQLPALDGHMGPVKAVALSADGTLLASGSEDQTVRLWDPRTGQTLKTLKGHAGNVNTVTFSRDALLLVSGSDDHHLRLWNMRTGHAVQTLTGHSGRVRAVKYSYDGILLASAAGDATVRLWDPRTGQTLNTLKRHAASVNGVAFSSNGSLLSSGSSDHTVQLWDLDTGQALQTLKGHNGCVNAVAFPGNSALLASGSADYTVRLWDVRTGQVVQTLTGHGGWVRAVTYSDDGMLLASASGDATIMLWDRRTGQALQNLEGHGGNVSAVAFSGGSTLLASGSDDFTIRLWAPQPREAALPSRTTLEAECSTREDLHAPRRRAAHETILSTPLYEYQPLNMPGMANTDVIRLVRLLPRDSNLWPPRCIVETHSVSSCPPYCAVSYTWGQPERVDDQIDNEEILANMDDQKQYVIIVNSQVFPVRRNLLNVLITLADKLCDPGYEGHEMFWIDAICINQEDIPERSAQVNLMSQIYRKASDVLVWLGTDDRRDAPIVTDLIAGVLKMQQRVVELSKTTGRDCADFFETSIEQRELFQTAGLPDLVDNKWLNFSAFFNREWFKRLWVFQEVALARHITMLYGDTKFEIIDLDLCAQFLYDTDLGTQLGRIWMRGLDGMYQPVGRFVRKVCQVLRWCTLDPTLYVQRLGTVNISGASGNSGSAAVWSELMLWCRGARTTEPRDRVYAMLGIVGHLVTINDAASIRADYSKSEAEVLTELFTLIMTGTQWLNSLCAVNHGSELSFPQAPSWVPDMGKHDRSNMFSSRDFDASKSLLEGTGEPDPSLPDFSILKGSEIHASGLRISTIVRCSEPLHQIVLAKTSFRSIAGLLASCSGTYSFTGEPVMRALWKTLAQWGSQCDQDSDFKRLEASFAARWLCWGVVQLQEAVDSSPDVQDLRSLLSRAVPELEILSRSSASDGLPTPEDMVKELLKGELSIHKEGKFLVLDEATMRVRGEFSMHFEVTSTGNRLFKTQDGYLGLGPEALKPGDEVWLIPRATVPIVLRPQRPQNDLQAFEDLQLDDDNLHREATTAKQETPKYQVLGESYLYGAMYGEALDRLRTDRPDGHETSIWDPIVLI